MTGASTGIGRAIVEYLAARGDHLLAGARRARDLRALGTLQNVVPVRLDVTQAGSDPDPDLGQDRSARRALGRLDLRGPGACLRPSDAGARPHRRPSAGHHCAVHRVLGSRRPRPRYLVTEANLMTRIAGLLPDRWLDFAISRAIRGSQ